MIDWLDYGFLGMWVFVWFAIFSSLIICIDVNLPNAELLGIKSPLLDCPGLSSSFPLPSLPFAAALHSKSQT